MKDKGKSHVFATEYSRMLYTKNQDTTLRCIMQKQEIEDMVTLIQKAMLFPERMGEPKCMRMHTLMDGHRSEH